MTAARWTRRGMNSLRCSPRRGRVWRRCWECSKPLAHSPGGERVRVRMGIHCGEAARTATGLVGLEVHRAARVAAVAHGGQVLVSEAAAGLVRDGLPPDAVPAALCEALRLAARPGRPPLEALLDALAFQDVLIVLDNCEHLIGACAK